jgi:hypothetical protein
MAFSDIANHPYARLAKTQQEMVEMYKPSPITEEEMDHPLCEVGFMEGNPLIRMSDAVFVQCVGTILKSRPSARFWDIVPQVPHHERKIFIQDPRAFKMSFEEKTFMLMEEFIRHPRMAGFKIELHNIGGNTGEASSGGAPSLSMSVYEVEDDLGDSCIPVKIKVRYRTQF